MARKRGKLGWLTRGWAIESDVFGRGSAVDEGGIRVNRRKDDVECTCGSTAMSTSCEVGKGHCDDWKVGRKRDVREGW